MLQYFLLFPLLFFFFVCSLQVRFHKSVIHSRAALTYDQAQLMLDTPSEQGEVQEGVRLLNSVAIRLRKQRMEAGALTLASPEVRFKLDDATQGEFVLFVLFVFFLFFFSFLSLVPDFCCLVSSSFLLPPPLPTPL